MTFFIHSATIILLIVAAAMLLRAFFLWADKPAKKISQLRAQLSFAESESAINYRKLAVMRSLICAVVALVLLAAALWMLKEE